MNKDEAEKWRDIAKNAIHKRDYEKALRFLHKSNKLFNSPEVDGLIKLWEMNLKNKSNGASSNHTTVKNSLTKRIFR